MPVGTNEESGGPFDGQSFYPVLTGSPHIPRETAFVHYDPKWSKNVNRYRNQFVRTQEYKLYSDGRYYDLSNDVLEQRPLPEDSLSSQETEAFQLLKSELEKHPVFIFE